MNKKKLLFTIPLIIFITVFIFLNNRTGNNKQKQIKNSNSAGMPINVSVYVAKHDSAYANIQVSGTLHAFKEVVIFSEIQARVNHVLFQEGENVYAGKPLVKLNVSELEAQLQKLKAQQKLKQLIFERNKVLLSKGGISEEEFNVSETELKVTEAEIKTTEAQLAKATITAPFSGKTGICNIYEGSLITPATPIVTLQQTDKLKLEFSIPEKYISLIKKGQTVAFKTASSGNSYFNATIYAFEPKVDETTRNLTVRAWFDNKAELNPGMFAEVQIPLFKGNRTISVPSQSVVPGLKTQKVYVVKNDSVVEKEVETGFRWSEKIEIIKGVDPRDSVVVGGIMYMRNHAKVKVTGVVK